MDSVLAALGAPRRREILRLVRRRERSAGEIHRALGGVTFGAVSQHLAVLERAGLVSARREGRGRYYSLRREALAPLRAWLDAMWCHALDRLKQLAEAEAHGGSERAAAAERSASRPRRRRAAASGPPSRRVS